MPHEDRLDHVSAAVWKIPLRVAKLDTASGTVNNIGAFDGAGDSLASGLTGYLINASDRCSERG